LVKTLTIDELEIHKMMNDSSVSIDIRDIHIFRDGKMHILCHNTGFHSYQFNIETL